MEINNSILALLLVVIIFILLVGVGLLVFLLVTKREKSSNTLSEEIKNEIMKEPSIIEENLFCENHPGRSSKTICNICENCFCEDCVAQKDGLYFCKEHYSYFLSNEWVELETFITTPDTPERGTLIYHFKQNMWSTEQLPTVLTTHYKIDTISDGIESHVKILVPKSNYELLKSRLFNFKNN